MLGRTVTHLLHRIACTCKAVAARAVVAAELYLLHCNVEPIVTTWMAVATSRYDRFCLPFLRAGPAWSVCHVMLYDPAQVVNAA